MNNPIQRPAGHPQRCTCLGCDGYGFALADAFYRQRQKDDRKATVLRFPIERTRARGEI